MVNQGFNTVGAKSLRVCARAATERIETRSIGAGAFGGKQKFASRRVNPKLIGLAVNPLALKH
jgi:hypothetical protein